MDIRIRCANAQDRIPSQSCRVAVAGLAALIAVGLAAKAKLDSRARSTLVARAPASAAPNPVSRDDGYRPGLETLILAETPVVGSPAADPRASERLEVETQAASEARASRSGDRDRDVAGRLTGRAAATAFGPRGASLDRTRRVGMRAGMALPPSAGSTRATLRAFDAPATRLARRSFLRSAPASAQALMAVPHGNRPLPSSPLSPERSSAYREEPVGAAVAAPATAPFISAEPGLAQPISGTGMVLSGPPGDFPTTGGSRSRDGSSGVGGAGGSGPGGGNAAGIDGDGGLGSASSVPSGPVPDVVSAPAPQSASPVWQATVEPYVGPNLGPIPYRVRGDSTGLLFPDISKWNPDSAIDWDALDSASNGIIVMKVIQGSTDWDVDTEFQNHLQQAQSRGMIVIGYAFGTDESGAAQADAVLRHFPSAPGRIVMLDWETDPAGVEMTEQQAIDFTNRIKERTGRYPVIYSAAWKPRPGVLAECPRYFARWPCYGDDPMEPCSGAQSPPSVFHAVVDAPEGAEIWQFTDGKLGPLPKDFPGIGPSDINMLMVTYDELRGWAGLGTTLASRY